MSIPTRIKLVLTTSRSNVWFFHPSIHIIVFKGERRRRRKENKKKKKKKNLNSSYWLTQQKNIFVKWFNYNICVPLRRWRISTRKGNLHEFKPWEKKRNLYLNFGVLLCYYTLEKDNLFVLSLKESWKSILSRK